MLLFIEPLLHPRPFVCIVSFHKKSQRWEQVVSPILRWGYWGLELVIGEAMMGTGLCWFSPLAHLTSEKPEDIPWHWPYGTVLIPLRNLDLGWPFPSHFLPEGFMRSGLWKLFTSSQRLCPSLRTWPPQGLWAWPQHLGPPQAESRMPGLHSSSGSTSVTVAHKKLPSFWAAFFLPSLRGQGTFRPSNAELPCLKLPSQGLNRTSM